MEINRRDFIRDSVKWAIGATVAAALYSMLACQPNGYSTPIAQVTGASSDESTQSGTNKMEKTTETERKDQTQMNSVNKKILVAYFSRTGNTREIANQIHEKAGGDIIEIVPINQYPSDYNECVEQAAKELEKEFRPALKTIVKNFESYGVIFIGYPNWWGTMPMPMFTFLEGHDFSGKTIAPFCTHEGSRMGISIMDITRLCPKSTILDGLAIRGSAVKNAQNEVSGWLRKLGMIK